MSENQQVASQEIVDNFELFDEWDDRYRYMIELGNGLPPLDEVDRREENRVQGCVSNVWLVARFEGSDPPRLFFGLLLYPLKKGALTAVS